MIEVFEGLIIPDEDVLVRKRAFLLSLETLLHRVVVRKVKSLFENTLEFVDRVVALLIFFLVIDFFVDSEELNRFDSVDFLVEDSSNFDSFVDKHQKVDVFENNFSHDGEKFGLFFYIKNDFFLHLVHRLYIAN